MTEPIRVWLTDAFLPLLREINTFGAMFLAEANEQFGADFVEAAMNRKLCTVVSTPHGEVVFLLQRARVMVGINSHYSPTAVQLVNVVCQRDAYHSIRQSGHEIEQIQRGRRKALTYTKDGRKVLALVQAEGYLRLVVRRIYKGEIISGNFDELHLYSYVSPVEMESLGRALLYPIDVSALEIDSSRFYLYSLKPWPATHPQS